MMFFPRTVARVLLFGLLSLGVGATQTSSAFANEQSPSAANIKEMNCATFRVTVLADHKAREFGVLLREYEYQVATGHPKMLRSYVFPETQAEFDFRVAATADYCELRENSLFIYGRGYDEGGDVVFRIRLDTSSWKYDFSSIRLNDEPN
jgi:hypothetical protein